MRVKCSVMWLASVLAVLRNLRLGFDSAIDFGAVAAGRVLCSADGFDLCHRGDACEGFTSKAECRDCLQVAAGLDFAGGVRLKSAGEVFGIHSTTVVSHRD